MPTKAPVVTSSRGAAKVAQGTTRRCTLREYPWKTKPFQHQLEGLIKTIQQKGRIMLYCEPGTGKSKIGLDFGGFANLNDRCDRILIVCPKSAVGSWERQIRFHLPDPVKTTIVRLEGSTKVKLAMLYELEKEAAKCALRRVPMPLQIVLINYESTWRDGLSGPPSKPGLLQRLEFDLMIADECHRISNPTAKQSKACYRIAATCKFRMGMTGTSIRNKPLDLYGHAQFLDPLLFSQEVANPKTGELVQVPLTWGQFKKRYADIGTPYNPHIVTGYKDVGHIFAVMDTVAFKRRKDECLDLPPLVFETIPVRLGREASQAYIEMAERMVAEIERVDRLLTRLKTGEVFYDAKGVQVTRQRVMMVARAAIAKLMRLRQITTGVAVTEIEDTGQTDTFFISDEKLQVTLDLVEDLLAAGEKIVIFAVFRPNIKRLADAIHRIFKVQPELVYGDVTGKHRDQAIARFHEGDSKIIICQVQSGSESIDLFAASHLIFYEIDYSYTNHEQAASRIHRNGQTRKCTCYHIIAQDTIDEDLLEAIAHKEQFNDIFMRRPAAQAGRIRNTIDKLREQVKRQNHAAA